MTKKIPETHKKIILEALEAKKFIDEKDILTNEIQARIKQDALAAVKDFKKIKYHLKVMKDVASLFTGND
jgi:hypothetical protein